MSSYDFAAQRLYVDADLAADALIPCNKDQANYLMNVLRLKEGDLILLFNGRDGEWTSYLCDVSKRHCSLQVADKVRAQVTGPDLHYLFAPLKRSRLDYMVQKATELGVSRLRPIMTHRTQSARVNLDRLRANVVEAAEQCGILELPSVDEPSKLDIVLSQWAEDRRLIYCDEDAPVSSPIDALSGLGETSFAVLIGPEGGFSDTERDMLSSKPFVTTISLGPRIMRADTAAVAALTLVNSVLGDWRNA